jgi:hypothetical protein
VRLRLKMRLWAANVIRVERPSFVLGSVEDSGKNIPVDNGVKRK